MHRDPINLDIAYHVDKPDVEDRQRIEQAAAWVNQQFGIEVLTASIAIVDDPTIHRLNRDHLQHDWPTDVISFVFSSKAEPPVGHVDGEIIASADTAQKLSSEAGWSLRDELLLYIVHGLLHLAGLDDLDDEQRSVMRAHEQDCLMQLGVKAEHHIQRWEDISY